MSDDQDGNAPLAVSKSVRLSVEQIAALESYAKKDRRDVSEVIRIAIDEFFYRSRAKKSRKAAA